MGNISKAKICMPEVYCGELCALPPVWGVEAEDWGRELWNPNERPQLLPGELWSQDGPARYLHHGNWQMLQIRVFSP